MVMPVAAALVAADVKVTVSDVVPAGMAMGQTGAAKTVEPVSTDAPDAPVAVTLARMPALDTTAVMAGGAPWKPDRPVGVTAVRVRLVSTRPCCGRHAAEAPHHGIGAHGAHDALAAQLGTGNVAVPAGPAASVALATPVELVLTVLTLLQIVLTSQREAH